MIKRRFSKFFLIDTAAGIIIVAATVAVLVLGEEAVRRNYDLMVATAATVYGLYLFFFRKIKSHPVIGDKDFKKNVRAYREMREELLGQYPGQWAGFWKGKLVAVGPDKVELMQRIRVEKGGVRAFLAKIIPEQERPIIQIPVQRRLK